MKIKEVKINNYKSLGTTNNRIILNDVTCIIGKNESGKTNIIEALSYIKMRDAMSEECFKKNNRINNEEISLVFLLEPYKSEKNKFKKLTSTNVIITGPNEILIEGGMSEVISSDKEFNKAKSNLFELINKLNNESLRNYFKKFIISLNNIEKKVMIFDDYIRSLKEKVVEIQLAEKDEIVNNLNICFSKLLEIYELFPTIFFVDSKSLKTEYTYDEIKTTKNSESITMLHMFLDIAGIYFANIEKYWRNKNNAEKKDFIDKFNKNIETNITDKFNNFYKQDTISCTITLENETIAIQIKTNGKSMEFSERSNGLKWYFNAFIKMLHSNMLEDNNILYLLDEPGVFLHVNAQKELLKFFEDLSSKGNQVIYTTHSPYMINQENMGSIRLVTKDNTLYTNISNNYNSLSINNEIGTQETLTPLLYAIGLDLKYNIGPDKEKINIIVEGITDFYYLNAYIKMKKKKENNIYIIPSVGVSKINKIASILIGWGCDYRILLDNDTAGRNEYIVLTSKLNVLNENILFTDGTHILDKNASTHEIENVFSKNDYQKIISKIIDYNDKKKIVALDIYNRAIKGEKVFDQETMKNFDMLLDKIVKKNN